MLRKRIIPCLDVKDGLVVKGVRFEGLVGMGNPADQASFYNDEGADELVILDITASKERRRSILKVIESVADRVFIPLTVGGGIRTTDDVRAMLNAGADRVSLNTASVERPDLIAEAAERFGSQCVVAAIDVQRRSDDSGWEVFTYGGSRSTGIEAIGWAKNVERKGAGEILLTSMDRDGTKAGYDLDLLRTIAAAVSIPVIASGGAGELRHFALAFTQGNVDAVLAASLFHSRTLTIPALKDYLRREGVLVR